MQDFTLQNAEGDHVFYAIQDDSNNFTINYYNYKTERAKWFNGRLHIDYTVLATPTKTGYQYTLPRRAPAILFYSPTIMGASNITLLDVYNCPATAIQSTSVHYIALPKTYSLGDAKSQTRQQWAALIDATQPQKIIIHLPELNYDSESPDFGKQLTRYAEFCIEIRNWFYTQTKKIIKPKNAKYQPAIFAQIGNTATELHLLTEAQIKALFNCQHVEQYYEAYSNSLPQKDIWQFCGKSYKTIDGEPDLQDTTVTEQIIQILLDVYRLRINLVTDESEVWSRAENEYIALDEKMLRAIKIRLNDEFNIKVSKDTLQEIVFSNWAELLHNKQYTRPTFHPYQDYFLTLPDWDKKTDYIQQLYNALTLDKISISTNEFTPDTYSQLKKALPPESINPDTNTIDWRRACFHYFKKWIVGIVVQCLTKRDVNALMPILTGGTNKGKSTYIKYLLPPDLEPYYIESGVIPSLTNYETAVNLRSSLLINFDDEPDQWPKHYWKSLKTMITSQQITYRAKYDKVPATHKRTASFVATSNFPDILNDPTGTRRFIMMPIADIQRYFWQQINIDSVWAQAVHLALNEKYPINLVKYELELLLAANAVFFEESTEEQILSEMLLPITEEQAAEETRNPAAYNAYNATINESPVLMREVDILNYLTNNAEPGTKLTTGGLRTAIQKLGFKAPSCYKQRTFNNTRNQRCYAVQIASTAAANKPTPQQNQTPEKQEIEVPF